MNSDWDLYNSIFSGKTPMYIELNEYLWDKTGFSCPYGIRAKRCQN